MRTLLFIALLTSVSCISDNALIDAFIKVFNIEDSIADIGAEPIQLALMQLRKHGLDTSNLCNLTETQQAVITCKTPRPSSRRSSATSRSGT